MAETIPESVQKFRSFLGANDFVFLVFYRGHWCPFCMAYLKEFASITKDITAAGGKPLIVSAENIEHLPQTRERSGYNGEAMSDPENALAKHLKNKGLLDVAITPKAGYPHDMAQPAVLVLNKDGKVFHKWAIVPSVMNLGGAKDRPSVIEIWEDVQAQMKGTQEKQREVYTKQKFTTVMWKHVFG